MMRVNFVGNLANNHYVLARFLREIGVDAHLFYDARRSIHEQPSSEDPELATRTPHWIHPFEAPKSRLRAGPRLPAPLRAQLADCDVLHVHGPELAWMPEVGKPFVWHPYGGDLFQLTSYHYWLVQKRVVKGLFPDIRGIPFVRRMREAVRTASAIALGWHNEFWLPGIRLVKRLAPERIVRLHLAIDAGRYSPKDQERTAMLRAQLLPPRPPGLVVFHPTRQAFTSAEISGRKGNDRLYRALGRLHREGKLFTLLVIAKGDVDERAAKELMKSLGIEDRVIWLPLMPRHELIRWYHVADVAAGDFVNGALGSISLEAMACACPLLMFMHVKPEGEDFLSPYDMFPELPPVLNARTDDDIYQELVRYVDRPSDLEAVGRTSREWVMKHGSGVPVAQRFLALYQKILAGEPLRST